MGIELVCRRVARIGVRLAVATSVATSVLLVSGCAGGNPLHNSSASAKPALKGLVRGGQQPVSGSSIQLYVSGTSGDGSAAQPLLSSAVLTDASGSFDLDGLYTCPSSSSLVYLVASGGNPGSGTNNPALQLMAALGPCGNITTSTYVVINEVTTMASVWALSPYMFSATQIGSGNSDFTSFAVAFQEVNELVNISTGTAPGDATSVGSLTAAALNTLADILAACVNSLGGTSGPCISLFTGTTPPGGVPPTNTLGAALVIANNPSLNVTYLLDLITPATVFQPILFSPPTTWPITTSAVTPAPSITPAGGSYLSGQTVTIADSLGTANIFFTTDGSIPTQSSMPYTNALLVTNTTTIRAIAVAPGYGVSAVTTALYNFSPSIVVNDSSTQYNFAGGFLQCSGICDLSPSFMNYNAPYTFSITKITFDWSTSGASNCANNIGDYAAVLSSTSDATGIFAVSSKTINWSCSNKNGVGELDFAGQPIPQSFYLDFESYDGLPAEDSISVSNVQIWGFPLSNFDTSQAIGLPILFVHGICDVPDSFLPAESAVKTYLQQQAPSLYPDMTAIAPPASAPLFNEYVAFFDGAYPQFQAFGSNSVAQVDSRTRFFLVDFNDGTPADKLYQSLDNNTSGVAEIPIYEKGYELASVIWQIKTVTQAPRVVVVAHSMGGLDARSYIEQLASPTGQFGAHIPYFNDIASLITLDTPHGGAQTALLSIPLPWIGNDTCSINPSVDKAEMIPNGFLSWLESGVNNSVQSIIPEMNFNYTSGNTSSTGNASPLPPGLTITSIVSTWDPPTRLLTPTTAVFTGLPDDDVLYGTEQDLTSVSEIGSHSESILTMQENEFGLGDFLTSLCGKDINEPLHSLLYCTGASPKTFGTIDNAIIPAAIVFPGQVSIASSSTTGVPSTATASGGQLVFSSPSGFPIVWSIREGNAGGTIDAAGNYTAPTNTGSFHIIGINAWNPSQYGEVAITVTP